MHRKGQANYFLESIFKIGFLMVALLAFFILINFYITNRIDTNRLQAEVTANRIMYSDAIMLTDKNYKTYTGIIDINKFSDTALGDSVNYATKKHATAYLRIIDNTDGQMKYEAYLNKLQYKNLQAVLGKQGKGSATEYIKNYPITYKKGNDYKYGMLIMNIIIPNS
jgi:hypothetical protein